jgi:Tfp pilus assembly protein PilE
MSVIDLLITIIVVTILVTIALGVATYIAYKLRLARQPGLTEEAELTARYFVLHEPPSDNLPAPERVDAA